MRATRPSDQRVEVQAIHWGDSVLLHCPNTVKVLAEAVSGGDITLSIDWNDTYRQPIEVYDGDGEHLCTIRPKDDA